jgi:two-component system, chemotaxis family, protein-glutamate methylesterase/glutaminase
MNSKGGPLNVLIVEDSPTIREFLAAALGAFEGIRIVATAVDGESAIESVKTNRPDVITMDVHLPGMNGFEATRKIMETFPTPIIIVSGSVDTSEVTVGFRALEAGALAILPRPRGFGSPSHDREIRELAITIKTLAEVKVVKRWPQSRKPCAAAPLFPADAARPGPSVEIVAIGSSTGGPVALKTVLSSLPKHFPIPLVIVQHMADGFTEGFAEWLAGASAFPVQVARHREYVLPGKAYLAPQGMHMGITAGKVVQLSDEPAETGLRPSVSRLFHSVAENFGSKAIGVLLTGMGKDGAAELREMRERGAITIAQDKQSSVVHGMPGEAIRLEGATHVLPADGIAPVLERLVMRR